MVIDKDPPPPVKICVHTGRRSFVGPALIWRSLSPCRLLAGEGTEQGWKVLKLVAVLYLAVLLGCTALINFSLGFILALTLVPLAAFITPHVPK